MQTQHCRESDRLLATRDLADRLNTTPETIRRWARLGRIPVYRVGAKTLRFDLAEVREALRRMANGTSGKGGAK